MRWILRSEKRIKIQESSQFTAVNAQNNCYCGVVWIILLLFINSFGEEVCGDTSIRFISILALRLYS